MSSYCDGDILGYDKQGNPSAWDKIVETPYNLIQMWKRGAATPEGRTATAPVRAVVDIVKSATGATKKAVDAAGNIIEDAPGTVKGIGGVLPVVLIVLAGGVAAYLVFAGKKGTKLTPF